MEEKTNSTDNVSNKNKSIIILDWNIYPDNLFDFMKNCIVKIPDNNNISFIGTVFNTYDIYVIYRYRADKCKNDDKNNNEGYITIGQAVDNKLQQMYPNENYILYLQEEGIIERGNL